MNKAQKRTWCKLAVSILGLLFMSSAVAVMKIYNLEMRDPKDHTAIRILGMFNTIPWILIALLDWKWKKIFDERDKMIDRKASIIGTSGAFIFLAVAGLFLTVKTRLGSVKADLILCLVVLALFVGLLVSSATALIQYGRANKGVENE